MTIFALQTGIRETQPTFAARHPHTIFLKWLAICPKIDFFCPMWLICDKNVVTLYV